MSWSQGKGARRRGATCRLREEATLVFGERREAHKRREGGKGGGEGKKRKKERAKIQKSGEKERKNIIKDKRTKKSDLIVTPHKPTLVGGWLLGFRRSGLGQGSHKP